MQTRVSPASLAGRLARSGLAVAVAGLAVGCGGGISIGFGYDGAWDNTPPSVSIAASVTSAPPGASVRLIAAASDESGIDSVGFYHLDGGLSRSLGRLGNPPYEITVTVPNDGRSVFSVYAQAFDRYGNRAQTAPLDIAVR